MFTNEIAELPAFPAERPLLPPRIEHFVVQAPSRRERAARAVRVARGVTFAIAVAFVILATTLPASGTTP